eukprot:SAG22_NODE_480_length_9955_cov_3.601258_6_plen_48_part_00
MDAFMASSLEIFRAAGICADELEEEVNEDESDEPDSESESDVEPSEL